MTFLFDPNVRRHAAMMRQQMLYALSARALASGKAVLGNATLRGRPAIVVKAKTRIPRVRR